MESKVAYPGDIKALRPLELHYFRVPRERWELMLTRARQMGADAISTVVPWSWHEPQDKVFDLRGITHPMRDMTDFLETCQAMGFRVFLRVRPGVGAGLLWGGVPGWLIQENPEIQALDSNFQPRYDPDAGSPLPSAEHPTFLKYLARWYQELCDALTSWTGPDGPVVALRLDGLSPDGTGTPAGEAPALWDYNPHVVEVQWPIWLRQQYDGIDALNAAWKTNYPSVSDAGFPPQPTASELSPQLDDAARFVAYAARHTTETYARLLREAGWTGPVVTNPEDVPGRVKLAHAVQVDPEPPQIGSNVRWAMDAPVRADGAPRRRFWALKAAWLGMEAGVKPIDGGSLVTAAESGRFRLPRPAGDYGIYRLLLDGTLLETASRKRGDTLLLDYVAADEIGETDMVIILDDPSAPLNGTLREYLASLLMGKAHTLLRAETMCQAVIEAFSGPAPPSGEGVPQPGEPSTQDLLTAEQSLVEARRAAQRAAASLGKLERLASEVRGEPAPTASLPDLTAFSPQELERLTPIRDACAHVAPFLAETARSLSVLCQTGQTSGEGLTLELYRIAVEAAQTTTSEAQSTLADALARLRADLASGALSPVAWTLQDWLTSTVQGLWMQWRSTRRGQSEGQAECST